MSDQEHSHKMGYEKKDVSTTKIILWTVGIVALIVVFVVGLNEYFVYVTEDVISEQVLSQEKVTLSELRAHEDSVLTSYGWSDSTQTSYRIPLDSAIKIVAAEAEGAK